MKNESIGVHPPVPSLAATVKVRWRRLPMRTWAEEPAMYVSKNLVLVRRLRRGGRGVAAPRRCLCLGKWADPPGGLAVNLADLARGVFRLQQLDRVTNR